MKPTRRLPGMRWQRGNISLHISHCFSVGWLVTSSRWTRGLYQFVFTQCKTGLHRKRDGSEDDWLTKNSCHLNKKLVKLPAVFKHHHLICSYLLFPLSILWPHHRWGATVGHFVCCLRWMCNLFLRLMQQCVSSRMITEAWGEVDRPAS